MKCEDCMAVIEDYSDGELDQQMARGVRAHLAACAQCASFYEELGQEQEIYARYQRSVDVTPALWAAVEARIAREKIGVEKTGGSPAVRERLRGWWVGLLAAPRFSPVFAAALMLVTIGVTVAVMTYLQSRNNGSGGTVAVVPDSNQAAPAGNAGGGEKTGGQVAAGPQRKEETATAPGSDREVAKVQPQKPAAPKAKPTPEQLVREAEQKYLAAIAILSRDVNRRRSKLDGSVLARFESTLAEIDNAIADTRQAVRQNPGDPIALNYMLAAYAKKVDVLREMARD